MRFGRAALAASLAIGGMTSSFGFLAKAQSLQPTIAPLAGRTLNLGREEHLALQALQLAAAGADRTAQDSALAGARAAVRSSDARYGLAYFQLQIGLARQDLQMQAQAVDVLVDSNLVSGAELVPLLANQAMRAYSSNEFQRADRILARMVELQPNNPVVLADYAQFKSRIRENPQAIALMQRAIGAHEATGRPAPESWYRRALALGFDNRTAPQAIGFGRALVAAYPSPQNWRDALLSYRALSAADPALSLDVLRLIRASQALTGERDYLELVEALTQAGLAGEAKAVLDEGVSRGILDSAEPRVRQQLTALTGRANQARTGLVRARTQALAATTGSAALSAGDAHLGLGQYAPAIELYQAALQKGGEDANLVNSRLGMALALAGRRAEAETILRTVTGPRADLAAYWLIWLARQSA
jgi:tetratricopeptide (TPR) repeat protein